MIDATPMSTLDLARAQFAVTTLFHFIFVPMSIGLALFVAVCQTRWHRTGEAVHLRMTRFWGRLLLISMAIGVVTGIVQEFQFGMNWSLYSRYVGDVFGAPLAMEGLIAFFLESTFTGLWIFGWGRLSPRLHLASVWAVALGTTLSAYFIIAANAWMQHPVGYALGHATHRVRLTDIVAVLTSSLALLGFVHTVLGAVVTGGMLIVAVSGLLLLRSGHGEVPYRSLRWALPASLVAVLATMQFGDLQGRVLTQEQPMKMAAAEAVYHTHRGEGLSLFATGALTRNPGHVSFDIRIPHLLSLIEDLSWNGAVAGIDQINAAERKRYGPGSYVPIVGVAYWSFRLMIGAGVAMALLSVAGLVLMVRRRRLEGSRWFHRVALLGVALPIVANWSGWVFTEMGRQPWVVYGLLRTSGARSPRVSSGEIIFTLAGYIVIYGILIAIGGWLMVREVRHGPEREPRGGAPAPAGDDLALAY